MVKFSIFAFLLGLAIYQGFIWTRALDTIAGIGASRDVFITLVVGTGCCIVFFVCTFAAKDIETLLRAFLADPNNRRDELSQVDSLQAYLRRYQGNGILLMQLLDQFRLDAGHTAPGGLAAALDAAAKAHVQCAEADRLVALEYARASNIPPNGPTTEHLNEHPA